MSTTQPTPAATVTTVNAADPSAELRAKIDAAIVKALADVTAKFAEEEQAENARVEAANAVEDHAIADRRFKASQAASADRAARFDAARQWAMKEAANKVFAEAANVTAPAALPASLGETGERGHVGDLGANAGK